MVIIKFKCIIIHTCDFDDNPILSSGSNYRPAVPIQWDRSDHTGLSKKFIEIFSVFCTIYWFNLFWFFLLDPGKLFPMGYRCLRQFFVDSSCNLFDNRVSF